MKVYIVIYVQRDYLGSPEEVQLVTLEMTMSMWVRILYHLALAAILSLALVRSEGAAVPAPDLRLCREKADAPEPCCVKSPGLSTDSMKRLDLPSVPKTMRVRRPAHLLSASEWEQLNLAYERMRALSDDDPRSMEGQRKTHCSYCTPSLPWPWVDPTTQNETAMLDVHASWLFLPWHRFFLYFHERILASLVGNESFALPYWNWDNQHEATLPGAIPRGYANRPSLYDPHRNPSHARPAIANLSEVPPGPLSLRDLKVQTNTATLRDINLALVHFVLVAGATTKRLLFGEPMRYGDPPLSDRTFGGKGRLEEMVHDAVHYWTGDSFGLISPDMGNPMDAAGDPVFYAHHSNIDRLWSVWKSMGAWRNDITDPDFLDAEFVFYNELAEPVVVKIRDGLDYETALRYTYEPAPDGGDAAWMNYRPRLCSSYHNLGADAKSSWVQSVPAVDSAGYTLHHGSPISIRLTRPAKGAAATEQAAVPVPPVPAGPGGPFRPGGLLGPLVGGGTGGGTTPAPATAEAGTSLAGPAQATPEAAAAADEWEEVLLVDATMDPLYRPGLIAFFLMLPPDFRDPRPLFNCVEFLGYGNDFSVPWPIPNRALLRLGLGGKLKQIGADNVSEVVITMAGGMPHHRDLGAPLYVHSVKIALEPVSI